MSVTFGDYSLQYIMLTIDSLLQNNTLENSYIVGFFNKSKLCDLFVINN